MINTGAVERIVRNVSQWAGRQILRWVSTSETFGKFVQDNADKIRRKFSNAREREDQGDVLAELEIARGLLACPGFSLVYEPYGSSGKRNPDFLGRAGSLGDFNLEVKRVRETEEMLKIRQAAPDGGPHGFWELPDTQRESFKFSDLITGCLGQLRHGTANVLAVAVHSSTHDAYDLKDALNELRGAAAAGKNEYFRKKGFRGAMHFLEEVQKLSAVVVKSIWVPIPIGGREVRNFVWPNSHAAVQLEEGVIDYLR
jgi:hypothetical protein